MGGGGIIYWNRKKLNLKIQQTEKTKNSWFFGRLGGKVNFARKAFCGFVGVAAAAATTLASWMSVVGCLARLFAAAAVAKCL